MILTIPFEKINIENLLPNYLEKLTDNPVHNDWELIQEVEDLDRMTKAIETGIPKMRIEETVVRKQAQIDNGQDTIIGANKYQLEDEDLLEILEFDNNEVRRRQIDRLVSTKKTEYQKSNYRLGKTYPRGKAKKLTLFGIKTVEPVKNGTTSTAAD